jgi:pimeloyl-ACP methyl ester carboxylesterase
MTFEKTVEILESNSIDSISPKEVKYPPALFLIQFFFQTVGRVFPRIGGKLAYYFFTKPRLKAKHRRSDHILESAKVFEFLYGKDILKAYEWGSGDKIILLVHGWESRGTSLRSFVPPLLKKGYRVVAFDGPAHGDSGGKRTNLPHFAGAVKAIINQIGEVYGIIAHSFGGPSVTYAMSVLDETIKVNKLVFVAVPSQIQWPIQKAVNTMKIPNKATEVFKSILQEKLEGRPLKISDIALRFKETKANEVLVVHDEFDPVVTFESAEHIFENWDNASLFVTKGLGHYRIMKHPDVIQRILQFIND